MISARGTAIKRRPRDLNSLEGQDFVVETLKHSIENNKIANAYIFQDHEELVRLLLQGLLHDV